MRYAIFTGYGPCDTFRPSHFNPKTTMDYHCLTSVSATHLEQINALMKRLHGGARTLTFGDLGRIMTTSQIWVATKDGNIEAIALAAPSEFLTHHTVRICNLSRIEGCDLQIMRDLLHEMVRNLPTSYPNADIHISIPRTLSLIHI